MNLRKHQRRAVELANEVITGKRTETTLVAEVTPGGGKSLLAALYSNALMDAGVVDRVLWVCPRTSLAAQAEEGFLVPTLGCARPIRKADNTPPLVRDNACGYVTTYQSIAACQELHRDEMRRARYLVILDEPHHLRDDPEAAAWTSALRPVVDGAAQVLLMTGTIGRHDGKRVPFMRYEPGEDGKETPRVDIRYTRRDALNERAVLPIDFRWKDGSATYIHGSTQKSVDISKASEDEVSRVISTMLSKSEYRDDLVRIGMNDWLIFRAAEYQSTAIVVCQSQAMARELAKLIKDEYQVQVALAISDEPDSLRTITQFRKRERGDVLVTVGMAYEGLDAPHATHMIVLTATRSVPWLEQAFARVTRVDGKAPIPYERQWSHIYVPDDPVMRNVVATMRGEQTGAIEERTKVERESAPDGERQQEIFIPLGATAGMTRYGDVDQGQFADVESMAITALRDTMPEIRHMPAATLLKIMRAGPATQDIAPVVVGRQEPSLSETEKALRKTVETVTRGIDRHNGWAFGATNKLVWQRFQKNRETMGAAELRLVLDYLKRLTSEAA